MKILCACLAALLPLAAQVPSGWNHRSALGSDLPGEGLWYGAGLWSGDHQAAAATLTDSLGLGNALAGGGVHLEAGYRRGPWDLAIEGLGNRTPAGQTYFTIYRSHAWYRAPSGWQGGFEQEPLVWGYGLNDGYVQGEAARPFPRLRIESPMADLHLGRVPLGRWGWQAFMGRLENHPVLADAIQNPSWASRYLGSNGTPEAPFHMGYRVQAEFGPLMEFYLNLTDLWGGTLKGRGMTDGYRLGDYATAMLGIKDALAEANTDYTDPSAQVPAPVGRARSSSEIDVGFRLQSPGLAGALKARNSWLYVSRGAKSAIWPVSVFLKRPLHYLGKDLSRDTNNVLFAPNLGQWWNTASRYTAPSLNQANDTVGVQASWTRVRAGLEYFACSDTTSLGVRPFTHGLYVTGFYYYGDPLGSAIGGEAVTTSGKLEVDLSPRLTSATTVMRGFRPFRDALVPWEEDHPGQTPGSNRFTVLQQTLDWKGQVASLGLGASWQRMGARANVTGAAASGVAWFADLGFHWPARPQ